MSQRLHFQNQNPILLYLRESQRTSYPLLPFSSSLQTGISKPTYSNFHFFFFFFFFFFFPPKKSSFSFTFTFYHLLGSFSKVGDRVGGNQSSTTKQKVEEREKKKLLYFNKFEYRKEVLDCGIIEQHITFLIPPFPGQQYHAGDSPRNSSSLNSSTIQNSILRNSSTKKVVDC